MQLSRLFEQVYLLLDRKGMTADELGRIVLPIEMRRALALEERSTVNLTLLADGRILLENADRCCRLCHSTGPDLIRGGEDWFCSACVARIKAL